MFIKKKKFMNTFSFLINTKYLILMCLKWETMVSKFYFVIDQCFCCTFSFLSGFSFTDTDDSQYVPTLPFWTGVYRFQRAAPVLPFITEISRFEMILIWMSDIYEFFKSITFFINWMWKSWLLVTKLGTCVALTHHLHHEQ